MKSTPILYTPENAQKSHVGSKTNTRRLNGLESINEAPTAWDFLSWLTEKPDHALFRHKHGADSKIIKCPYGTVGDRLWVREAWCFGVPAIKSGLGIIPYYGPMQEIEDDREHGIVKYRGAWGTVDAPKWRSSLHMPKWACRTWLEITAIRAQRLQQITAEDCQAEGVECSSKETGGFDSGLAFFNFMTLWESIHGPGSWELNPWVWALTFRRIEP